MGIFGCICVMWLWKRGSGYCGSLGAAEEQVRLLKCNPEKIPNKDCHDMIFGVTALVVRPINILGFRASERFHGKAQLEGKGCFLFKSCNAAVGPL